MRTFNDNTGRTWTVNVNIDAIKRVKSLLEVDLLAAVDGKLLERLVSDPVLLCDIIYCICKPEADAKEISDEDFGRSMAGDAIDAATTALLEELVDFFPSSRRAVLAKALAKLRKLEAMALEVAEQKLDSPELDEQMRKILGDSSGPLPASLESTPES